MSKTYQFDKLGNLKLQSWKYRIANARYPTSPWRLRDVAVCSVAGDVIRLAYNHYSGTWYVIGTGHGFAGSRSKAINTISTKSARIAKMFEDAIRSGRVEIVEVL